jgi:hypothetical protein
VGSNTSSWMQNRFQVVYKIFWFTRETLLFLLNVTILTCIWINCEMYLDLNYVFGFELCNR